MRTLTDEIQWGSLWLARDTDAVTQFDPAGQRVGEIAPLIDAASPAANDYGNTATALVLGVTRQHESPAASRFFILNHLKEIAALTASATPRALVVRYKAATTSQFTIAQAILTSFPAKMVGSTSIFTYNLSGGAVS